MSNVYEDVVCPVCGCLCDDLQVTVDGGKVVKVKNACAMGTSKFLNYLNDRIQTPFIRKNGSQIPITLDEAITEVAEILAKARYPLLYGLSLSSCEAVKAALELVEEVGGVVDNQTTICHGPGVQALHDIGEATCSLGEVRHRADLVVFWGCNPEEAHPRHFERYSLDAKGRFRSGRVDRKLIVVDVRKTMTAKKADKFIQIEPGKDYELLNALRVALRQDQIQQESVAGIPVEQIEELAETLRSCEFGMIFYGQGVTQTGGKGRNVDALFSLVRDLNSWTKFSIMPLRGHFNVTGVNQVTTWQTGFPYGVDFSHGYPWYNPGETTAVDIIRRGENDALLVVGSDPFAHFPRDTLKHMRSVPLMVIDPAVSLTSMVADVVIPSSVTGVESDGVAYRMDGVALPLKKVVDPQNGILPDDVILRMILEKVISIRRSS